MITARPVRIHVLVHSSSDFDRNTVVDQIRLEVVCWSRWGEEAELLIPEVGLT